MDGHRVVEQLREQYVESRPAIKNVLLASRWLSIFAGGLAIGVRVAYGHFLSPWPSSVKGAVLLVAFAGVHLFLMGQKSLYLNLFGGLSRPSPIEEESLV